jgi:hypothetical protein
MLLAMKVILIIIFGNDVQHPIAITAAFTCCKDHSELKHNGLSPAVSSKKFPTKFAGQLKQFSDPLYFSSLKCLPASAKTHLVRKNSLQRS